MEYFCDVLDKNLVLFNDREVDKKTVLEDIAERMCRHHNLNGPLICQKILAREDAHSTGIGAGIAIPHCRLPDIDRIYAAVLISRTPIEFAALDEKPVQLIFMFVSPLRSAQEHLKFLHFITSFSKTELYERAINTRRPEDFLTLFMDVCRQEGKL